MVEMLRARGGSYEGGQRPLARLLGVEKSWLNEVLSELADAGEIILRTTRCGSGVELAA